MKEKYTEPKKKNIKWPYTVVKEESLYFYGEDDLPGQDEKSETFPKYQLCQDRNFKNGCKTCQEFYNPTTELPEQTKVKY